jgi:hypothetical protein
MDTADGPDMARGPAMRAERGLDIAAAHGLAATAAGLGWLAAERTSPAAVVSTAAEADMVAAVTGKSFASNEKFGLRFRGRASARPLFLRAAYAFGEFELSSVGDWIAGGQFSG